MPEPYYSTYVINLEHATERRIQITQQLNKLGIKHNIVKAIWGNTLSDNKANSLCNKTAILRNIGRAITKPEIGAYLSHYEIYKKIAQGNTEINMVLEDDVTISPDILDILSHLKNMSIPWKIIFLCHASKYRNKNSVCSFWHRKYITKHYKLAQPQCTIIGMNGYLIRKEAAIEYSNSILPITDTIDNTLGNPRINSGIYVIFPRCVEHLLTIPSYISKERTSSREKHERAFLRYSKTVQKIMKIPLLSTIIYAIHYLLFRYLYIHHIILRILPPISNIKNQHKKK